MKLLSAIALLLVVCGGALGSEIHVPGDEPTIQAGIDAASPEDVVIVACGTYFEHDIVMKSGVTLRSETGLPDCVTIDALQLGRVIKSLGNDDTTLIEGLTLTGGYIPESAHYGGGIHIENGSPRVERCLLAGNYAEYKGGGAYCIDSEASFTECLFVDNEGENGGGGGMGLQNADVTLTNCTFKDNYGIDGGGIFASHSSPLIEGCLFVDNEAMIWGGALVCISESSPLILNCTIIGSDANQGGGIWVAANSNPVAENCIIAFNIDGSGVWVHNDSGYPQSAITLVCCDSYDNGDGNYGGEMEDQTGIDGNISEHPRFCDQEAGVYTLAMNSPCLPDNNDCSARMGAFGLGCDGATAAPPRPESALALHQNVPNPFNPSTKIGFTLDSDEAVELAVFDLTGRRVRTLLESVRLEAGVHSAVWNGRDDSGRALPSGVYLARLVSGTREAGITMVLLK